MRSPNKAIIITALSNAYINNYPSNYPELSLPPTPAPSKSDSTEASTDQNSTAETTSDSGLPIARPLRRIAALVYDIFLLAAISIAYATTFFVIQIFTDGNAATQILTQGQETTRLEYEGPLRYFFLFGWWLCLALFYNWCWRRSGQTLGMKTWHICLEQLDESAPGTG